MQQPTVYDHRNVYDNGAGGGIVAPPLYREQIKDGYYTYVQIGDKYFTIESLYEDFPGIGSSFSETSPYRLKISRFENYGYYYNYLAVAKIDEWLVNNNSPWRVATKQDFETLLGFVDGDLRLPVTWNVPNGTTNKSFFSAFGSGYLNSGTEREIGANSYFITSTQDDGKNFYLLIHGATSDTIPSLTNTYFSIRNAWPVRLVKDV